MAFISASLSLSGGLGYRGAICQGQVLAGHTGRVFEIGMGGEDCTLLFTRHGIDPNGRPASRETLHHRQPPGAMGVIGGGEDQRQRRGVGRKLRQDVGVKPGGGVERLVGQDADANQRQLRSRVSVMPIDSPFSLMASLMIFTVTASTRASEMNKVSQM